MKEKIKEEDVPETWRKEGDRYWDSATGYFYDEWGDRLPEHDGVYRMEEPINYFGHRGKKIESKQANMPCDKLT